MNKINITGEDLKAIGYPEGKAIGKALRVIEKMFDGAKREFVLTKLQQVLENPKGFTEHVSLQTVANALIEYANSLSDELIPLNEIGKPYKIFGADHIEQGAIDQMEVAMKLPVTVAGALMPDAHQGYGLPIGGVLATKNAIIPYGVGVDIGCRMALSCLLYTSRCV